MFYLLSEAHHPLVGDARPTPSTKHIDMRFIYFPLLSKEQTYHFQVILLGADGHGKIEITLRTNGYKWLHNSARKIQIDI